MDCLLYRVGEEPFCEWERNHNYPSKIILTGSISADMFGEFAQEFDYTHYTYIEFDGLNIQDITYDNGFVHTYEEYIFTLICFDAPRLLVLTKLYLNKSISNSFIVSDGMIYSADHKTLVHIPESTEMTLPCVVNYIGVGVCCGYENMLKVHLNDGLKGIGSYAFVAAGISHLKMPDSLETLGEDVFLMSDLETVKLSNSLKAIPDGCFNLCLLDKIEIPTSVTFIGNKALRNIWSQKIKIPEGVERIGYDVFEGMHYVYLPSTLKRIEPDFYYEECIDSPDNPPYIEVHPDNPIYYSEKGSLYFRETNELAIDSEFKGLRKFYT